MLAILFRGGVFDRVATKLCGMQSRIRSRVGVGGSSVDIKEKWQTAETVRQQPWQHGNGNSNSNGDANADGDGNRCK